MLVLGPMIRDYGWRSAVLVVAALVLFVSWPVVAFCLREPSPADIAARKLKALADGAALVRSELGVRRELGRQ